MCPSFYPLYIIVNNMYANGAIKITINATSYTIITAHTIKQIFTSCAHYAHFIHIEIKI